MKKRECCTLLHTQAPGITMYRFGNFERYIKGVEVILPAFDKSGKQEMQEWEHFITEKSVMEDLGRVIRPSDYIVFQRTLNVKPAILAIMDYIREVNRVTGSKKLIGMDIDDYMFNVPEGNAAKHGFYAGSPLFNIGMAQLAQSDFVVCSTNYLKQVYTPYNPNCLVVGNNIDPEWWGKIRNNNKKNKKLRIGWMGANGHGEDLKILDPVIDEILAKYPDKVEFYLFTPQNNLRERKGLIAEKQYVTLDKYPEKIKSLGFDIGVAPLLDCQFNRGKSANRYLELSMLGIPSVCSDIGGEFNEAIEHERNGYLAKSPKEFVHYLSELIENHHLRANIGQKALENVLTRYNAKHNAEKYTAMLKEARRITNEDRRFRPESNNITPTDPGEHRALHEC